MEISKDQTLPNFSVGWELEAIRRATRQVDGVEVTHDGSVNGESLEYRLKKDIVYDPLAAIEALRRLATDPTIKVDHSCGFHVHIGLGRRSRKLHTWAEWFVQLAREIEPEAFGAVPERRRENQYCRSWRNMVSAIGPDSCEYTGSKMSNRDRYNWVNPVEIFRPGGIRTVEVRLMGSTLRYTHLLAWVAFCRIMAASSWGLIFDPSRLESEKIRLRDILRTMAMFNRGDVEKEKTARFALTLADKAGLIPPNGKVLSTLKKYEMRAGGSVESNLLWDRDFLAMELEYGRVRRPIPSLDTSGMICRGDTVLLVEPDPDGGCETGQYYRVSRDSYESTNGTIGVLTAHSACWYLPIRCVRLVERLTEWGAMPCAV